MTACIVADALSQPGFRIGSISRDVINFSALATAQQTDNGLQCLRQRSETLLFQEVKFPESADFLLYDASTGRPCLYVPPSFRRQVFDGLHSRFHTRIRGIRHLLKLRLI